MVGFRDKPAVATGGELETNAIYFNTGSYKHSGTIYMFTAGKKMLFEYPVELPEADEMSDILVLSDRTT